MKGKICDDDKGLLLFSIIFAVFGIVSIIIGFIELPFFPIGIAMVILAILIMIPHEYIDKDIDNDNIIKMSKRCSSECFCINNALQ